MRPTSVVGAWWKVSAVQELRQLFEGQETWRARDFHDQERKETESLSISVSIDWQRHPTVLPVAILPTAPMISFTVALE